MVACWKNEATSDTAKTKKYKARSMSGVLQDEGGTIFLLPCPVCQKPTDRLKQFRLIRWLVFLGHFHWHQPEFFRACPPCMKRRIWYRCLLNIPTAHIIWPFVVLPAALFNSLRAGNPGHTPEILLGLTPEQMLVAEKTQAECSIGRIMAMTGALTCWLPFVGLIFSAWAWFLNRFESDWRRPASGIALMVSMIIHMLIAAALLVEAINKM